MDLGALSRTESTALQGVDGCDAGGYRYRQQQQACGSQPLAHRLPFQPSARLRRAHRRRSAGSLDHGSGKYDEVRPLHGDQRHIEVGIGILARLLLPGNLQRRWKLTPSTTGRLVEIALAPGFGETKGLSGRNDAMKLRAQAIDRCPHL